MDNTLYRRPDKPHLPGYRGERGAGFVLTWLGVITMGSTCPFAVVLCAEWLRDPRRIGGHRVLDKVAVVFASVGSLFWVPVSCGMATAYHGAGARFVFAYWCGFAVWLIVRVFTRWRQIGELRRLDRNAATGERGA